MKNTSDEAYISMWDEFAERKASQYLDNKYALFKAFSRQIILRGYAPQK